MPHAAAASRAIRGKRARRNGKVHKRRRYWNRGGVGCPAGGAEFQALLFASLSLAEVAPGSSMSLPGEAADE
jgi:hypothetical protein